jgi:hypothetical protein
MNLMLVQKVFVRNAGNNDKKIYLSIENEYQMQLKE